MRNDGVVWFKYRFAISLLLKLLVCFGVFLLLGFLADGILNEFLANLVAGISPGLYGFIVHYKIPIIFLICALTVLLCVYTTFSKAAGYIQDLVDSIDKVFQKDETLIELPGGFRNIENKLNTIKYDTIRNEQIAKEAEQRKNDLVVYLAHDLKTPLTSVIGYLNLLNEVPDMPQEQRIKYLGISLDKAQRLEDLINEFFEITRFNLQNISLETSRINLSYMLSQLADEFYPLFAEKNITCKVSIQPDIFIIGDADKLARVFDNVLRNAINYSYLDTTIGIIGEQIDEYIRIRFLNQGPQIPAHKLNSIFEKFYRLDSSRSSKTGGAGLGLAIAKEIVELHKGTIEASSNENYTEFTIHLPA